MFIALYLSAISLVANVTVMMEIQRQRQRIQNA